MPDDMEWETAHAGGPEPESRPEHSCCHERKKHRSQEEYRNLINRLNRVEGQIRGIRGMVEKSAYCPDILSQVSAATAALNAFRASTYAAVWPRTSGQVRTRPSTSCWPPCKS